MTAQELCEMGPKCLGAKIAKKSAELEDAQERFPTELAYHQRIIDSIALLEEALDLATG